MGAVLNKLLARLFTKELELVVVGLEDSGKTTFLNQLTSGEYKSTFPTIGLNVK